MGRPNKNTPYSREITEQWTFIACPSESRIFQSAQEDGIFPLITNIPSTDMTISEVLSKCKYQPFIEKRHQQMKSVFDAMPVFFLLPYRIEALLFIYFVVLCVNALIERDLRGAMKAHGIPSLELYPEERQCQRPTTGRILMAFRDYRRHILRQGDEVIKTFNDRISNVHRQVLQLLKVSETEYGK